MKKKKLAPKTIILFMGILILTGCVLAMVLNHANATVEASNVSETSSALSASSEVPELSVAPIEPSAVAPSTTSDDTSPSKISPAFDPAKESSRSEPLTTSSKSTSTPPKPVIEGDSVDGRQPTNSALTDKNHKPTYTSKPTVTSETNSSKSTDNDTSIDPIFGDKTSPKGSTTIVDGAWGEGSQVGIMD
jgi:cytoskeletal protein RodZ